MEIDAIKKLIETDENTRNEINNQYQKRSDLKCAIEAEKKSIYEAEWKRVNDQVSETRSQLEQKIKDDEEKNKEVFNKKSQMIKDSFNNNKDKWHKELYEYILK